NAAYELSDNLLRVGNIQSLSVNEGYVYFFHKDLSSASMLRLPASMPAAASNQAPEVVKTISLSANRYLNELTGHEAGRFFYTTKRGSLYEVTDGAATQIYPQGEAELLNFPV